MKFYQEKQTGDYLCIDEKSKNPDGSFEGRATAISKNVGSVCTTGISQAYLSGKCKRVKPENIPANWINAMNGPYGNVLA